MGEYYFCGKCIDAIDAMELQEVVHWNEWSDSEYEGIDPDYDEIKIINQRMFDKMVAPNTNKPEEQAVEYYAYNEYEDVLWAYDKEGIHWFYTKSGIPFFEVEEDEEYNEEDY